MDRIRIPYEPPKPLKASHEATVAAVMSAAQKLPDPETCELRWIRVAVAPAIPVSEYVEQPVLSPYATVEFERRLFIDNGRETYRWECPLLPGRFFRAGG